MTVAQKLIGLQRGISSPAVISGLQVWVEADQASVSAVQPNTISGLQLWLKADAITGHSDGDAVATWSDSSGNGYDATATGAGQPTYKTNIVNGLPVVRFNGTANFMKLLAAGFLASTANVTGVSVLAVVKGTASSTTQKLLHISTNASGTPRYAVVATNTNVWQLSVRRLDADSTTTLAGTVTIPGAFQCLSTQCNYNPRPGTGIWEQGANDAKSTSLTSAGSTSNTSSADAFVGATSTVPANPFNGDIAELIVYNVSLTPVQRLAIEKYLCAKYGLTAIGCPYVNGDVVQTWQDLSGNGYNLIQNTAANKPLWETNTLNGKPTVLFNGTSDFMPILPGTTFASTLSQPFTYVIVAQENDIVTQTNNFMDDPSGNSVKFSGTYATHPTNPHEYLMDSSGGTNGIYGGSNTDTNWHIYTAVWDTTDVGRKDGVSMISGNTGSGSITGIQVGATNAPSMFLHGSVAAALVYNRALSNTELNELGNYYASKYALTWNTI